MYQHFEFLLEKIENLKLDDAYFILSKVQNDQNIYNLVKEKLDWDKIKKLSIQKRMRAVQEARCWRFTEDVVEQIEWSQKNSKELMAMIKESRDGYIAIEAFKTERLSQNQIIEAIHYCHEEYIDSAIRKSFDFLSSGKILRVVKEARHHGFVIDSAYESRKLNFWQSMFLIGLTRNYGVFCDISQKIIRTKKWKELNIKETMKALNLSKGDEVIAKALIKKINWKEMNKDKALNLIKDSKDNHHIVLAVKKHGLIGTSEINKKRTRQIALKSDFEKMEGKEIVEVLRKKDPTDEPNANSCMFDKAIKTGKLTPEEILQLAPDIQDGEYSVARLIKSGSFFPKYILKGVDIFSNEYFVVTAAIKCKKLTPQQMLWILKRTNNDRYVAESIEDIFKET